MSDTIPFRVAGTRATAGRIRDLPGGIRHNLYDWVVVYRYWNGDAKDLRMPTYPEAEVLMRLGRGLSDGQLADRLDVQVRQVERWRARFNGGRHE